MKNLKKVLALGLSATMVSSMFVTAGAAFTDQADIKAGEAVNMLSALGVINGYEDGSYKPETVVTRAEMAKMIFVVRNNKVDDSAYENLGTKFADIKGHWAAGYIKFCESQGIIAGKTATQFDPDAPVTGVEAAKMLLVLTGYDASKAGLVGSLWATNTLKFAAEAGILDDVDSPLESGLPRQYAAQQIYNTLEAHRVKWSNDSGSFDDILNGGVHETVGRKYMNLHTEEGTLTSMNKDGFGLSTGSSTGSNFTKVTTDYSSLLGQKVKVMTKDGKSDKVLGVYATDDNTTYTVKAKDAEEKDDKIKFGGKTYTYEYKGDDKTTGSGITAIRTYQDGSEVKGTTLNQIDSKAFQRTGNMYTFADTDNNGKIDTLMIKTYKAAEVTYVSSSKVIAGGKSYDVADNNIASGLVSGDWAVITKNPFKGDDFYDIAKADVTTGTVKGTKNSPVDEIKIDDSWFKTADKTTFGTNADVKINTVKVGDTVNAVNVNGIMYYVKRTSGSTTGKLSDVALVMKKDSTISGNQVKLQFFDDTTKVVDVDDDSTIDYDTLSTGTLYEYTVSGGEYSFDTLTTEDDYYGDYTFVSGSASASEDQTKTYNGTKIADTAQVILAVGAPGTGNNPIATKVLTGKQFKSMSANSAWLAANFKVYGAFKADMDGLKQIGAYVVKAESTSNIQSTSDNYGYITSAAYKSGTNQISYKIWTANGEKSVYETGTSTVSDKKKGMVIGYSSINEDGEIKDAKYQTSNVTLTAITGVNSKSTKITLQDKVNGFSELDIDGDSTVLYINTEDAEGVEAGTIKEANKDVNGFYMANALVIGNGDSVELLIVDTQNNFDVQKATYAMATKGETVTAAAGTALTASTPTAKVKVAGEVTGAATVNVVVTNTTTSATGITATATKTAAGQYDVDFKLTSSAVAGTYDVILTIGGKDYTAANAIVVAKKAVAVTVTAPAANASLAKLTVDGIEKHDDTGMTATVKVGANKATNVAVASATSITFDDLAAVKDDMVIVTLTSDNYIYTVANVTVTAV